MDEGRNARRMRYSAFEVGISEADFFISKSPLTYQYHCRIITSSKRSKELTMTMNNDAKYSHFQCLPSSGRALNIRRVHSSCSATDTTEILIDGEWEESRMTLADMRRLMAFGYSEWIEWS